MPVMETKNFGKISFEPESELEFPSGLPGFDSQVRPGKVDDFLYSAIVTMTLTY